MKCRKEDLELVKVSFSFLIVGQQTGSETHHHRDDIYTFIIALY